MTEGTTSKMRADNLQELLPDACWDHMDTDSGFRKSSRLFKTIAFRFRSGPLVSQINRELQAHTECQTYDLVWVDKGVYLWPETVDQLRSRSDLMVHFTPDTAFCTNRSRHFDATASCYDLLVTTKSFELERYHELVAADRVLLTTQAYDNKLHKPNVTSSACRKAAVFIGLCEPDRENCMEELLSHDVPVRLGGHGWEKFLQRHAGHPALHFLGKEVFGEDYVNEYASASVGLGLLSKRFPELHTTRTFEIPACGALLATERNPETTRFLEDDEVLFFENYRELAADLKKLLDNPREIEKISEKGHERITAGGYDYASVLSGVLNHLNINEQKF